MNPRCIEGKKLGVLDGDLAALRELFVGGEDVATDDECVADGCEADVWKRGGDMSERDVFKKEADEQGIAMYADMVNDGDGFGKENIVSREAMGVKIGPKKCVCGSEVGEENVLAIMDETWLKSR